MKAASPSGRAAFYLALTLAAAGTLVAPAPVAAQNASAGNVNLRLTVPAGVTKMKGVIMVTARGIASGWANGMPFAELAKRLSVGIIIVGGGDDLNDPSYPNRCKSGEFNGIPDALTKLAMVSNHPELANAPIIGVGHSHGGDYWNWFTACHPERMALVFVHASGGVNYSAAALEVPVFYELGTGDLIENGSKKPRAGMFVNRAKGAPMALVLGQGEGHNNVTPASLDMIITLIEATWKLRVPADADPAKGPVLLNKIDEKTGGYWVGDHYTKEIAPWTEFKGNKSFTSFLPSEEIAKKWKMTGPALPESIKLPEDTCSWCGKPTDEPAVKPSGMAPPNNAKPDAGAAPPDAGDPTPEPVATGGASGSGGVSGGSSGGSSGSSSTGGASGSSNTGGAAPSKPDPVATGGAPASSPSPGGGVSGGCSYRSGARDGSVSSSAALAVLLLLAAWSVLRRVQPASARRQ